MFPTVSTDGAKIDRRRSFPAEFDICLFNRCNLSCRYCYWDKTVRTTREELSFGQVARGLELYLSAKKGTEIAKISISGGEPFLNFPLLARVVRHARKTAGSNVPIEVFTNGTHLTERNVRCLLDQNIRLVVSMDGKKRTHDSNRVFGGKPGTSVFDAVMANLQRLPRDCIERMYAGVTFTSKTAPLLGENVRFLLGLGFREVLVDLDILEAWPPGRLRGLRKGLAELKELHDASLVNGFGGLRRPGFCLDFLLPKTELGELRDISCFREISLAPDGCFYPNGLISTRGSEKSKYRVGDLKSGFNFRKMKSLLDKAASFFRRAPFRGYAACPVHIYFDCLLKGKSPCDIFVGGERVFECANEIVGGVVELEHVCDFLASHASFGDFEHYPRRVSENEIRHLMLGMNRTRDIGCVRDEVDFFLYSPGNAKRMVIHWDGGLCSFEDMEAVAVYSVMKSRHLGKRLSVSVISSGGLQDEHSRFLMEQGITVEKPKAPRVTGRTDAR